MKSRGAGEPYSLSATVITGIIAGIICLLLASKVVAASDDEEKSLPLPRFVSLKADDVNMRVGPGVRYEIKWVYKHEGLPVEITQEFEAWRKIRDPDGTVGWVHKQMLQSKRTAVIRKHVVVLRKSPDENSQPVIRAEPGVIGTLLECKSDWCRLQVSGHKCWIEKTDIWGVYKNEKF